MNFAISAARPYQTHDILQAALLTGQMGEKKRKEKKKSHLLSFRESCELKSLQGKSGQ